MTQSKEDKIKKQYDSLKNLDYTNDEAVLKEKAEAIVAEREAIDAIDLDTVFPIKSERKLAKELLRKYLTDYSIETISDRNTLTHVIFLEILNVRLQEVLNKAQSETKAIPIPMIDAIHRNLEQLSKLKILLGITKNAKDQNKQDGFAALEVLKRKGKKWLEENQGSRTLHCPHCGKYTLLKIRMAAWEAQKHPFFRDRILGNEHLINLYKEKKLTREDLAQIFEVSPDYVDWLIEKCWCLVQDHSDDKPSSPPADSE